MTLNEIRPGQGGVIATVGGEGALRRRLLDMGLTPNTRVEVRKVAPMGDPIELFLRGYVLTIRRDDAAKILLRDTVEAAEAAARGPALAEETPGRERPDRMGDRRAGHGRRERGLGR